ncbi:hypothetical protein [Streptomyces sp. NPDC092307]|uniref:hypothetical protein n=1 Tax=Streptomyces sp. NPDC092307 TaxID=3366013 RepID=UPI003808B251
MTTIKRAAVTAPAVVEVAAPAAPTATATAAPAYRCASSTHDIDDTSYGGPWPDNWRVTVKTCAARRYRDDDRHAEDEAAGSVAEHADRCPDEFFLRERHDGLPCSE